ncbi:MAG: cytochrome c oxidase subunit 4 [Solirubrobacterales bacterium]
MSTPSESQNGGQREEIHLPGPTLLPLATAAGITVSLVGLIVSWWIVAFGVLVTLIAIVRWVRTVRGEIAKLPSDQR